MDDGGSVMRISAAARAAAIAGEAEPGRLSFLAICGVVIAGATLTGGSPACAGGLFGLSPWSGFYIGVHAGGTWSDLDDASTKAAWGGRVGYGLQFGMAVIGVEADATWGGSQTSGVLSPYLYWDNQMSWNASLRGRAGLAFDKLLVFGTLGVSYLNSTTTLNRFGQLQSSTNSTTGLVYGAGVEYRILPMIDLRLEILRTDYTLAAQSWAASPTTSLPGLGDTSATDTVFRAGVGIHF